MADDMKFTHQKQDSVKSGPRSWTHLPPEERAVIIDKNVDEIFRYGEHAATDILRVARENFARDFTEIKSERMRKAVLRSLGEPATGLATPPEMPTLPAIAAASADPPLWRAKVGLFLKLFIGA
jgi:hypothetical protein